MTVREYEALPRWRRIAYRLYRNPVIMFRVGPAYLFLVQNRLPLEFMRDGWRPWVSAMGTNLAIAAIICGMIWIVGAGPFLTRRPDTTDTKNGSRRRMATGNVIDVRRQCRVRGQKRATNAIAQTIPHPIQVILG